MKTINHTSPRPVVFFDSGIGGLNLLRECAKLLPSVGFVYFADNDNVPYGGLPTRKILALADAAFEEIEKINPSAAVLACNTVTARCAVYLRKKYSFPIVGIQPAVKPAAAAGGRCVVLATPATARSASVKELVEAYGNGNTQVVACPALAAYIEEHIFRLDFSQAAKLLPAVKADSIVLGCTHYIFLKELVKRFYGCPVYDGLMGTARRLRAVLGNPPQDKSREEIVFCGGDADKNRRVYDMLVDGSLTGAWGNFSQ